MIIDCIADTHGFFPKLEGGDLLIVAGDLTARDTPKEHLEFVAWLRLQPYEMRIFIGGNHDNALEKYAIHGASGDFCYYLCDSGMEFNGFKIYGSPWIKTFPGMNPHCKAFTVDTEEELAEKFAKIPEDTDILITHSPPWGILDTNDEGKHCGSKSLACRIGYMKNPPKLWVWGHIHESYGIDLPARGKPVTMVNASHVNERYQPVNRAVRIEL
jgi:Icc-related predicted phosphoesterase